MPDFLPPAQRVLFMRIQQKQQEEEERARRLAEGGAEKNRDAEGKEEPCVNVHLQFNCDFVLKLKKLEDCPQWEPSFLLKMPDHG